MYPPPRGSNSQQDISLEQWERHHEAIKKLYLTDGHKLPELRKIMEREYDFRATQQQYKTKLKEWKIEKRLPRRKVLPMIRKKDQRQAEGKQTEFMFHGQPVSNEKLERSRKRLEEELAQSPTASTPSYVEYMTPRSPASELDMNSPRPIPASINSVITTNARGSGAASTVASGLFDRRVQAQNSPPFIPNSMEHHSSPCHNRDFSSELLWPESMQIDSSPKSITSPAVLQGVLHGGNPWSPSQWNLGFSISLPQTPQAEPTTPSIIYRTLQTPVSIFALSPTPEERPQSAGSDIGAEELGAMQILFRKFENARILINNLENRPLAIKIAGAYITTSHGSIQAYLSLYQEKLRNIRSQTSEGVITNSDYSTIAAFEVSFEELEREHSQAADLLLTCAFLHHDNIPKDLIRQGLGDNVRVVGKSVSAVDRGTTEDWKFERRVLPHLLECYQHIKNHPYLQFPDENEKKVFRVSSERMALALFRQAQWREAEELQLQALDVTQQIFGQEHPDTLTSMSNLASTYRDQGRYKEAEELEVQTMEARKRVLCQEHPDTLTSMSNLASTYRVQGRYKEAEELEVQTMEARKRGSGAEELDLQTLEMRKRVLSQEHPDTLCSISHLASTNWVQGRLQEAEELDLQTLEMRKRVLGQEHPGTLSSMSCLASTYREQGRLQEAKELYLRTLEMSKGVLGQEHPNTLCSMSCLASTYREQRRLQEAEELYLQTLEMTKRVLGQEHPDTLCSMSHLALTYREQRRLQEAEELGLQTLEMTKRVLGQEHPGTLSSMSHLASTYREQRRLQEAEELYLQTLEMTKRVLGQEHPGTLSAMSCLASTYREQRQLQEAEELYLQTLEMRKRVLSQEHPDTLRSMSCLVSTYWDQGRWKEAEELGLKTLETSKRVLGQEHPHTLISIHNLAYTFKSQGRIKEAITVMTETKSLRSRNLGVDNPDTKDSVTVLSKWTSELEGMRNDPTPQKYVSSSLVPIGSEFVHEGSGIIGAFQYSVIQYEHILSHLREHSQRAISAAHSVLDPNFLPFVPIQYTAFHTTQSSCL
ncbi:hypothetical protein BDD12DRAFT_898983 [Trichophaea hybrida]|nr:hypothetical protein BDD12DRAFT_898983 [Trichophaea hybrida]